MTPYEDVTFVVRKDGERWIMEACDSDGAQQYDMHKLSPGSTKEHVVELATILASWLGAKVEVRE